MASTRNRSLLSAALCAVLAVGIAAPAVQAATGDVLIEFRSELQTLPMEQGWLHWGQCLRDGCPGTHSDPDPINYTCFYQGWWDGNTDLQSDNNCLLGIGCRKFSQAGSPGEHYNAPIGPADNNACTYTEWIAFDNGNNLGFRPLTIFDSTVPGSPPWGAPSFNHAPSYPVLRIVTGDGNLVPNSLPIQPYTSNHRNQGQAEMYQSFVVPGGVTSVTLLIKAAAGPRPGHHAIVGVTALGQRFAFGVDGDSLSSNYRRFTYGLDRFGTTMLGPIPNFTGLVTVAQPTTSPLPHSGEFFTLRAILHANGDFRVYLNEQSSSVADWQINSPLAGSTQIMLTPDADGDATAWIDYVKILEGEVPLPCPDPVFDNNRDENMDQTDMDAFLNDCATGPANANGTWASRSFECQCMDVNHDQSIDMNDFAVLQRCITTGGGGLVPTCDN